MRVEWRSLKEKQLRELLEDVRRHNLPIVEEEGDGDEELDRDTIQIVDDGDYVKDSDWTLMMKKQ